MISSTLSKGVGKSVQEIAISGDEFMRCKQILRKARVTARSQCWSASVATSGNWPDDDSNFGCNNFLNRPRWYAVHYRRGCWSRPHAHSHTFCSFASFR